MSSGGMEWAYRMIAAHKLDPLGLGVVMHLGWRDAPNQRTDSGIARTLGQHRSAIRKATAKLAEAGVIERRSGQWVACETVAIVEERANAPRPDAHSADEKPAKQGGHSVARHRPLSGHQNGHSVATKRKENLRKGAREDLRPCESAKPAAKAPPCAAAPRATRPARVPVAVADLTNVQQKLIREDKSFLIDPTTMIKPGSPEMLRLRAELRSMA